MLLTFKANLSQWPFQGFRCLIPTNLFVNDSFTVSTCARKETQDYTGNPAVTKDRKFGSHGRLQSILFFSIDKK